MEAEKLSVENGTNGQHESTCDRPKTLPMKLNDYKSGENIKNCSSAGQFQDAACRKDSKDGLENGLGDTDGGDYYGDSEEEIIEVVYAFADYTIAEDESNENQVRKYWNPLI